MSSVQMNEVQAPKSCSRFDWREDLAASRDLKGREIEAYGYVFGVRESAGINRLGIENERVLRRTTSH